MLEESSWITLTSLPIVACLCGLIIMHYSIVVPVQWLAANSHALSKHDWSVRSMVRVLDVLHDKIVDLSE